MDRWREKPSTGELDNVPGHPERFFEADADTDINYERPPRKLAASWCCHPTSSGACRGQLDEPIQDLHLVIQEALSAALAAQCQTTRPRIQSAASGSQVMNTSGSWVITTETEAGVRLTAARAMPQRSAFLTSVRAKV